MRSRRLWTCIIDFRGGTYLKQRWAMSAEEVLPEALTMVEPGEIPGLTEEHRRTLIEEVRQDGVGAVPVEGLPNVYCVSAVVDDHLLLAHVVETVPVQ